jgi:hypothetical protein
MFPACTRLVADHHVADQLHGFALDRADLRGQRQEDAALAPVETPMSATHRAAVRRTLLAARAPRNLWEHQLGWMASAGTAVGLERPLAAFIPGGFPR